MNERSQIDALLSQLPACNVAAIERLVPRARPPSALLRKFTVSLPPPPPPRAKMQVLVALAKLEPQTRMSANNLVRCVDETKLAL